MWIFEYFFCEFYGSLEKQVKVSGGFVDRSIPSANVRLFEYIFTCDIIIKTDDM